MSDPGMALNAFTPANGQPTSASRSSSPWNRQRMYLVPGTACHLLEKHVLLSFRPHAAAQRAGKRVDRRARPPFGP